MRRTPTSLREALHPRRVLAMPLTVVAIIAGTYGGAALGHALAPPDEPLTTITSH